ncbi:MAG: ribosome biogenesis factor YjgA [Myxococcota bacterium]|nr:ribosome biogenesis factor YjgA [Myxococcota bacterium]
MAKKTRFQWEADSGQPRDQPLPSRGRSKKKREAKAVEPFIDKLLRLGDAALAAMPFDEDTVDAIKDLRRLEAMGARGGLRRKRLQVAGLLRRVDIEELRDALSQHPDVSPREQALQQVELWRTRLLRDGDKALDQLLTEYPDADRQHLRQLIRQAKKDRVKVGDRSPKSYRDLFSTLRALIMGKG